MKLLIVACLVAYACADVSHILPKANAARNDESEAKIRSQELDVSPEGAYSWAFDTENGIQASASGSFVQLDPETVAQKVQGGAAWTSPEGESLRLEYIADENGYQPQGAHLPTPHPIPEAILRALEYIRNNPPAPEKP